MSELELPSVIKESLYLENYESEETLERILLEDLQMIDKISIKGNNLNEGNILFQPEIMIKLKQKNILDSIEEEDSETFNNISSYQQKLSKTVELAQLFSDRLALPIEEINELDKVNNQKPKKLSIKHQNSKILNMSIDRLSRLSEASKQIENSLYFKDHDEKSNSNEYLNKSQISSIFDFESFKIFDKMQLMSKYQIQLFKSTEKKEEILSMIVNLSIKIVEFVQKEDAIFEKFYEELQYNRNKINLFLRDIKLAEDYLEKNIDNHSNFSQVLFKSNLWMINLKKMTHNIFNLFTISNRISAIQKVNSKISNKIRTEKNFGFIVEEYKNKREIFYNVAINSIERSFNVDISKVLEQIGILKEETGKIISNISKKFSLWINKQKYKIVELSEKYDEFLLYRSNILPSFSDEIENLLIIIFAYIKKYKKCFNVYQDYTQMVNEIFNFRKNHLKSLKTKINIAFDKIKTYSLESFSKISEEEFAIENKKIIKDFKTKKEKSFQILQKIKRSKHKKFLMSQYEKIETDLQKIKGSIKMNEVFFKFYQEASTKIAYFNLIKSQFQKPQVIQSNLLNVKDALAKQIFINQELNLLIKWLEDHKIIYFFKQIEEEIINLIYNSQIKIECLSKIKRNFELNKKIEYFIMLEEQEVHEYINKIKEKGKEADISNFVENLNKFINEFEFLTKISYEKNENIFKIQKIIEYMKKIKELNHFTD